MTGFVVVSCGFVGYHVFSWRWTITHRILSIFLEFCVCFHEARERSKMSRMAEQGMTVRQYIRWFNAPGLEAGSIPFVYARTYCVYECNRTCIRDHKYVCIHEKYVNLFCCYGRRKKKLDRFFIKANNCAASCT